MTNYCFHYFISILHSVNNVRENMHSHTLEIVTYVRNNKNTYEQFDEIEKYAGSFLSRYDNHYMNDMAEFEGDASVENIAEVFFEKISAVLEDNGYSLERLEMSETPLRTYIISRTI